jgi:hypothetical protein
LGSFATDAFASIVRVVPEVQRLMIRTFSARAMIVSVCSVPPPARGTATVTVALAAF